MHVSKLIVSKTHARQQEKKATNRKKCNNEPSKVHFHGDFSTGVWTLPLQSVLRLHLRTYAVFEIRIPWSRGTPTERIHHKCTERTGFRRRVKRPTFSEPHGVYVWRSWMTRIYRLVPVWACVDDLSGTWGAVI